MCELFSVNPLLTFPLQSTEHIREWDVKNGDSQEFVLLHALLGQYAIWAFEALCRSTTRSVAASTKFRSSPPLRHLVAQRLTQSCQMIIDEKRMGSKFVVPSTACTKRKCFLQ